MTTNTISRTIEVPASFTFSHGDAETTIETAEIPDTMLVMLMQYGRRKCNDTLNSKAKEARDEGKPWNHETELDAWAAALQAGTLGMGASRTRGSAQDRFERDWMRQALATATHTSLAAIVKASKGAKDAASVIEMCVDEASQDSVAEHFAKPMVEAWARKQDAERAVQGLDLGSILKQG